jgi:hypothetical protein
MAHATPTRMRIFDAVRAAAVGRDGRPCPDRLAGLALHRLGLARDCSNSKTIPSGPTALKGSSSDGTNTHEFVDKELSGTPGRIEAINRPAPGERTIT